MGGQRAFLYFIGAAVIMQFWDFNSILIEIKVKTREIHFNYENKSSGPELCRLTNPGFSENLFYPKLFWGSGLLESKA